MSAASLATFLWRSGSFPSLLPSSLLVCASQCLLLPSQRFVNYNAWFVWHPLLLPRRQGWKVLFRCALAVLDQLKNHLMDSDLGGISLTLRELKETCLSSFASYPLPPPAAMQADAPSSALCLVRDVSINPAALFNAADSFKVCILQRLHAFSLQQRQFQPFSLCFPLCRYR